MCSTSVSWSAVYIAPCSSTSDNLNAQFNSRIRRKDVSYPTLLDRLVWKGIEILRIQRKNQKLYGFPVHRPLALAPPVRKNKYDEKKLINLVQYWRKANRSTVVRVRVYRTYMRRWERIHCRTQCWISYIVFKQIRKFEVHILGSQYFVHKTCILCKFLNFYFYFACSIGNSTDIG